MLQKIVIDSPEYACFHEAGHAEVALRVGARVLEMGYPEFLVDKMPKM